MVCYHLCDGIVIPFVCEFGSAGTNVIATGIYQAVLSGQVVTIVENFFLLTAWQYGRWSIFSDKDDVKSIFVWRNISLKAKTKSIDKIVTKLPVIIQVWKNLYIHLTHIVFQTLEKHYYWN